MMEEILARLCTLKVFSSVLLSNHTIPFFVLFLKMIS